MRGETNSSPSIVVQVTVMIVISIEASRLSVSNLENWTNLFLKNAQVPQIVQESHPQRQGQRQSLGAARQHKPQGEDPE